MKEIMSLPKDVEDELSKSANNMPAVDERINELEQKTKDLEERIYELENYINAPSSFDPNDDYRF